MTQEEQIYKAKSTSGDLDPSDFMGPAWKGRNSKHTGAADNVKLMWDGGIKGINFKISNRSMSFAAFWKLATENSEGKAFSFGDMVSYPYPYLNEAQLNLDTAPW